MILNLPNRITFTRLLLAVVFFVLVSYDEPAYILDIALVVFVVACVTDILDGYLARKYNMITVLGRISDPFVDKVIVCGAFILLINRPAVNGAGPILIAPWMAVVLVSREFLVSSIRGYAESQGIAFGSELPGKLKAIFQMIALGAVIYFVAHGNLPFIPVTPAKWITFGLVYLALVLTVLSAVSYILKARRAFAPQSPEQPDR